MNPNEMDANAIVPTCSWILADMIRYSPMGAVNVAQAQQLVDSLTARRYPLIEEVDGRVYFHHNKTSAPEVALMTLLYAYPRRVSAQELIATIRRHGFSTHNARVAVGRIRRFVDDDGHDALKLLATGLQRADRLLSHEG